jgi:hypothetical protein
MSKLSKIFIIIIVGLIIIASAVFLFVYNAVDGLDTSMHKENKVVFPNLNDTIYVMASSWGLTGDHIEIVVSHSSVVNRSSSIDSDYIFYEPTIYFKRDNDTLIFYSLTLANIPRNFDSRINIKQIKVEDIEQMKRYEQTHENLELTEVTVYN